MVCKFKAIIDYWSVIENLQIVLKRKSVTYIKYVTQPLIALTDPQHINIEMSLYCTCTYFNITTYLDVILKHILIITVRILNFHYP